MGFNIKSWSSMIWMMTGVTCCISSHPEAWRIWNVQTNSLILVKIVWAIHLLATLGWLYISLVQNWVRQGLDSLDASYMFILKLQQKPSKNPSKPGPRRQWIARHVMLHPWCAVRLWLDGRWNCFLDRFDRRFDRWFLENWPFFEPKLVPGSGSSFCWWWLR